MSHPERRGRMPGAPTADGAEMIENDKSVTTRRSVTPTAAKPQRASTLRRGMSLAPCDGSRRYVQW